VTIEGVFRRRRLPHWDVADATYFVTACLADSIPARGLGDLRDYRRELDARLCPEGMEEAAWEVQKHKLVSARFDEWIDMAPASKHLQNPALAQIVRTSLFHFAGERYWLLAYVVMPSHYHWVFKPRDEWCEIVANTNQDRTPREQIMHSIQSFTANQCNSVLCRKGTFWQDETYDHCVRNDDELHRVIRYVERNPVKAQLASRPEEWQFSSAFDRHQRWIAWGEPLPKK
jgi:putative transposase